MNNIAIGLLGTTMDRRGRADKRWDRWRPTISMCQHEDLPIDRLELLFDHHSSQLAKQVSDDIAIVSPETNVVFHKVNFHDPWDFESVFNELLSFVDGYDFKPQQENYFIHITTGTHVAQICLYLLTEAGYFPGRLLQTSPVKRSSPAIGQYQIIDLDLSKYDRIASRFQKEHQEGTAFLKDGIKTHNVAFNKTIAQLEKVSIRSKEPILLTGPTGAGKSQLAARIFELRQQRCNLAGRLVTVNCATLKGDNAMSALFGHKKGAFTGAMKDRPGLLQQAHQGLLFLDEIGELGLDEQAMLLRAIEDKLFMPLGSDQEVSSDFQIIAGTNRDLLEESSKGHFREDLLARIDLWSYQLPSLKERLEDLEPNIDYELQKFSSYSGYLVSFNRNARKAYLSFGQSPQALWSANFRDLNASITRMATLSDGGRITLNIVEDEIQRLLVKWSPSYHSLAKPSIPHQMLTAYLEEKTLSDMDYFDQYKLAGIIETCLQSKSMAEAGRRLFNVSRTQKTSYNDSHRVKQILDKYHLTFSNLQKQGSEPD